MSDSIRIRFSVGLIFIAIDHAVLLEIVLEAVHSLPKATAPSEFSVGPLRIPPSVPSVGQAEGLPQPSRV